MAGLRERRHQETRAAIVDAAFALFLERGFAEVTMEEIATAAGVSRSTAYRRFPTKEDVVLEVPRRWLAAFDIAFAELPDDVSLRDATRTTCRAVATHIDSDRATVLAAYAVLEEAPGLQTSGIATRAWLERIVTMIERFGPDDIDRATSGVIAGAYLGGLDAMMQLWADGGAIGSVLDTTERLVDRLEPILP